MKKLDLRTVSDLSVKQFIDVLQLTAEMKDKPDKFTSCLKGKTMTMINEKQSLRTKVTFEAGIQQLGGFALYLTDRDISLGKREPVKDVARNLSRWVDIIVARVNKQSSIEELAEYASIPVINALSDGGHPCQVIADMFTIWDQLLERKSLRKFKLTYIGDGNNVCNSLILVTGLAGIHLVVCTPSGYEPDSNILRVGREMAHLNGGALTFESDPAKAVASAQAIYTDVWTSMGQEEESEQRRKDFKNYQVNEELLSHAPDGAAIMHCLPAHRDEEITDDILESEQSIVFDQAENRLHTQKALMKFLVDNSS